MSHETFSMPPLIMEVEFHNRHQHPTIPGNPAIFMVVSQYGNGRALFVHDHGTHDQDQPGAEPGTVCAHLYRAKPGQTVMWESMPWERIADEDWPEGLAGVAELYVASGRCDPVCQPMALQAVCGALIEAMTQEVAASVIAHRAATN